MVGFKRKNKTFTEWMYYIQNINYPLIQGEVVRETEDTSKTVKSIIRSLRDKGIEGKLDVIESSIRNYPKQGYFTVNVNTEDGLLSFGIDNKGKVQLISEVKKESSSDFDQKKLKLETSIRDAENKARELKGKGKK